jgi:hypothetical protein
MQFTLIGNDDGDRNIVVFVPGNAPCVAHSSHPNFDKIVEGAMAGDDSIVALFDVAATAAQKFDRLSERVTTAHGRLYLDGEEVNNALAEQVMRFIEEGLEDWKPLVLFFENVQANPQEHSREQLFTWLAHRAFTITRDGMIVGYKGVTTDLKSIHSGKAIVDGEVVTGQIPNHIGAVVEMPRGEVQHDPSVGCHIGLHVGTYEYANSFAQGALLEVHVNPRDVVSVPTDSDWAKVRCCRYTVVGTLAKPYDEALVPYDLYEDDYLDDEDEDDYLDDEDDGWGDGEGF